MLNAECFSLLNMGDSLSERITRAMEAADLKPSELARRVGVSPSAVNQWQGGGGIDGPNLIRVALATEVNPIWLGLGKGDQFAVPMLIAEPDANGYKSIQPRGDAVVIPVFSAQASMGAGVPITENDTVIGGMQLSANWVSRNLPGITSRANLAVISAMGNSMSPTFSDGDILLVDRGVHELKVDAVYVLAKDDELFVKRVHRKLGGGVVIKSDNPLHGQEEIENPESVGLRILGRVVWAWNGKRL
jgi:phage repressor protein C with HTH and peptisase S24 domain